jgi:hypothetical protein
MKTGFYLFIFSIIYFFYFVNLQENSFFKFFILFICAYNIWVISPSFPHPLPYPPAPSLVPPTPSLPGRNYFAIISNFVEERV